MWKTILLATVLLTVIMSATCPTHQPTLQRLGKNTRPTDEIMNHILNNI